MGERGRCDVDVLRALGPAVGCPGRRAAADHGGDDERLTLLPGASSVASLIEVSVIGGHYHQPLLRGPGRTVAQRRQQTSEPLVLSEYGCLVLGADPVLVGDLRSEERRVGKEGREARLGCWEKGRH